jgi:hypothetical protein
MSNGVRSATVDPSPHTTFGPKENPTHITTQEPLEHPITDIVMRPDITHTVPDAIKDSFGCGEVTKFTKQGGRERV